MRGAEATQHEKLGLKRIAYASQFTFPDKVGMCPDVRCINTDMMSSRPNQASYTPNFLYPLVSSTLFSPSSPICLFVIHDSTIVAEPKVSSSLSISPCHHELTLSTAYTEYSIHQIQHTPNPAYTKYSIHQIQHTPNTAYTKYSIHQMQQTPNTASTEYSIHPAVVVL